MFLNDANGKPGVYKLVCAIIHPLTVLSSPPIEFYRFTTTSTMPTYPEMFHVVWALQCASTELTIFSRELGKTVTIA